MYAKKSLGQHFLRSEKALNTIIKSGEISPEDNILEIGPGEGALTEKLLATSCQVLAVEKDDNLYELLKGKFQNEIASGKLILIHGDILDFEFKSYQLEPRSYKLIANIPYNITGAIFKKFLSVEKQPSKIVLLVQKEVAKRIIARDGKESILSISVKAYGEPKLIEKVLAGSFTPAPKVDSAIIAIENISKEFFKEFDEKNFFQMLKAGFQSKRKKLSSNLSVIFDKSLVVNTFEKLDLDPNTRAEDVSVETWKKLANCLI